MKRIYLKGGFLKPVFETRDNGLAEWFGYYNYDTLDKNHSRLLCNHSNSEKPAIDPSDTIDVGYYSLQDGVWYAVGTSNSWNWQQGAMLQWLPIDGNYNKVIYNTSKDNRLIAIIHDLDTGEDRQINWPIYGIMPDAKASISIDLERSYWCRAYHYSSVINPLKDGNVYEDDGIYLIDLINNNKRTIIGIRTIINTDYRPEFDGKKHWLEHVMISPTGKRFCFLHRFSAPDNVYNYKTRLCVANVDGTGLQVISGWESFRWSHFGWQGDDAFVIYSNTRTTTSVTASRVPIASNTKKGLTSIIVPIIKMLLPEAFSDRLKYKTRYYQRYKLNENSGFQLVENLIKPYFSIDGHPSFTADGKYMITDSYVDGKNYRRVIIYNVGTGKGTIVAKFLENRRPGNVPCDLHPKLSQDNNYIVFDTTNSGMHKMQVYKIDWNYVRSKLG